MSIKLATKHALKNPITRRGRNSISRFGAILTDGSTYYYGWNAYKTHPLAKLFGDNEQAICIHAELDCLSKLRNGPYIDLSDYTLYVARVLKDGTPALAKPCLSCQRAIIHFGVGDVEWTE